jgi:hypothetical protein
MRPDWARMPVVAIAIDLMKSIMTRRLRALPESRDHARPSAVLINARLCV